MSVLGDLQLPSSIVWGEFASFAMLDAPAAQSFYQAGGDPGSVLHSDGTNFLWGGPAGYSTVWPDSPDNAPYRTPQRSTVETLVVSGTVDFSTPAGLATDDLLPLLPNGRQVIWLSVIFGSQTMWPGGFTETIAERNSEPGCRQE